MTGIHVTAPLKAAERRSFYCQQWLRSFVLPSVPIPLITLEARHEYHFKGRFGNVRFHNHYRRNEYLARICYPNVFEKNAQSGRQF